MNVKKVLMILFLVFIALFFIVESLVLYYSYKQIPEGDFDYIIVLGSRVYGKTVSLSLKYRLDKAIEYMRSNDKIDVVVTGAKGYNEEYSEASVMKKYLVDNGISEDKVIIEDKSFTTIENLKNSFQIIGKNRVLIATNDFHMFRSIMLAKRVGFEAYPLNSRTPKVVSFKLYFREFFAVVKSFIFDR